MQEQSHGKLKSISYYSRKTTPEEAVCHSFELECLAIVAVLEKFQIYLLGMHFAIRTDCNSLKLLTDKRDLNPRIGRSFIRLSEFNYKIKYLKGDQNKVADALSRNPVKDAREVAIGGLPEILGITINTDWVAAMQRACEETKRVVEKLKSGDKTTHEKFTLYHGRVYRASHIRFISEFILYATKNTNYADNLIPFII
jgi:hypothetical protein